MFAFFVRKLDIGAILVYVPHWIYTNKVDTKAKGRNFISNYKKYDEDFKKILVNLYHGSKTKTSLCKEYGISFTALSRWVKQYSEIKIEDGSILTARPVKELQKKNALLEENLILKKAIAIFTPHSNND